MYQDMMALFNSETFCKIVYFAHILLDTVSIETMNVASLDRLELDCCFGVGHLHIFIITSFKCVFKLEITAYNIYIFHPHL